MDCLTAFRDVLTAFQKIGEALEKVQSWYERNAETITAYIEAFSGFATWITAVQKMVDNQIVFTDDLTIKLAKTINDSDDVNAAVLQYYSSNNEQRINELIHRCERTKHIKEQSIMYSQIITAYTQGLYQLACTGLFSLLDGVLSDVSGLELTSFKKRLEVIEHKIGQKIDLSDIDRKIICVYISITKCKASFFGHSDFSQSETDSLNRHWVMHGRTRRTYTQLDFIKVLLWLDAIVFLEDICSCGTDEDKERYE
jgi:hypothetical protein